MHGIVINSKTLVTPANAITIVGFVMAICGAASLNTLTGVVLLTIGRALDVIDGPVARRTVSSRFGAGLDALCDKLALLAVLIAAWHYAVVPLSLIIMFALLHVINTVVAIIAQRRKRLLVSSIYGKYAAFTQNIAIVLFAYSETTSAHRQVLLQDAGWILSIVGVIAGVWAATGYARAVFWPKKS